MIFFHQSLGQCQLLSCMNHTAEAQLSGKVHKSHQRSPQIDGGMNRPTHRAFRSACCRKWGQADTVLVFQIATFTLAFNERKVGTQYKADERQTFSISIT